MTAFLEIPVHRIPPLTKRMVLLAVFGLTACAQVPQLGDLPDAKPIHSYQSASTLSGSVISWPSERWWESFGDAQLSQLIDEALRESPSMAVAQSRLALATSLAQQAGAALLPSVTADASISKAKQSYNNGVPE
ncbi:MAG TPA: multidrug transporter, partial [Noviherbaspirillum sp.]|nr:multidrug transporter [Noviherbaspirillum sp.]